MGGIPPRARSDDGRRFRFFTENCGRDAAKSIAAGALQPAVFRQLMDESIDCLVEKLHVRKDSITRGARNWCVTTRGHAVRSYDSYLLRSISNLSLLFQPNEHTL